ncbi:hypothetical protein PCANC_09372 [Puccinia coronata f. sp. avenae]|uniref:Uncharacterized protein n=1 Tax=Puccinia coronata f. sp. avenae TaxID=200324 RepID=A0A2N5VDC5_9BASI|nr:hypothetical protein PCANC_18665 [Puccinia coronata f. sp. avenae]PLW47987.1 hypothetical protein PCANC_09372 [Puccinia coronata f. sp. avenae]
MLSTASRPIGDRDNLPKRHTAWPNLQPQNIEAARGSNPHQKYQAAGLGYYCRWIRLGNYRHGIDLRDLPRHTTASAARLLPASGPRTDEGRVTTPPRAEAHRV